MAEDIAELETRPAEPNNEKPEPAPTRRNDD
jgi:hypothetical protein